MDSRSIIKQVFSFLIYLLAQVLLVRHFVLFDGLAACYIYVGFLLLLPFEMDSMVLLALGTITGLVTDIFYDTLGIHTAACVFIMYLRPFIIKMLNPRGGYDEKSVISLSYMGLGWFVPYVFMLVLIHHLVLFIVEASSSTFLLMALLKSFLSSIFTTLMLIVSQYIFYRDK